MVGHYLPYTATKTKFEWSSANTSIATINKDSGVVTGIKSGTSTITIKSTNPLDKTTVSNTCTLKVKGEGIVKPSGDCNCTIRDVIYYKSKQTCDGKQYKCIKYEYYKGKRYPYYSICCTTEWYAKDVPVYGDVPKDGEILSETGPSGIYDNACYLYTYCSVTRSDGTKQKCYIDWTYYSC